MYMNIRASILSSHVAGTCTRTRAILHQHDNKNISTQVIFQIYGMGVLHQRTEEGACYIAIYSTMDYIIQEDTWSSSGSSSQRMKQATSKVFESKSIYIVTEFHASDELL